ncbi:hypothetical protein SS209_02073 [Salmonella enterica subsp. enterica serovar Senftenberg str. SS209]|nr:hypothetical protein SS209_02073 [Salmonella enterica subsp. enterica serovar Senftenberg str. SS209]
MTLQLVSEVTSVSVRSDWVANSALTMGLA